jgi:hypothetical protein
VEKSEEINHLQNIGIEEKITFNWVFEEHGLGFCGSG